MNKFCIQEKWNYIWEKSFRVFLLRKKIIYEIWFLKNGGEGFLEILFEIWFIKKYTFFRK